MPTFSDIDVEFQITERIDIDFEVYCGTCGAGLCGESETRKSRGRGYLQVSVNVCPDCMKEKEDEIKNLQDEIEKLENRISFLEEE